MIAPTLSVTLQNASDGKVIASIEQELSDIAQPGRHVLGDFALAIPADSSAIAGEYLLTVSLKDTDIANHYTLWSYTPGLAERIPADEHSIHSKLAVATTVSEAMTLAKSHDRVLLFLSAEENPSSIEGTYCTDFWCYPMFRSISESMGREIPVGTLGLLIDKEHPALSGFPCRTYSTPQWHSIVTASRSTILDDTDIKPIVQTIDNFERNHRLGLIYEVLLTDLGANLLICTSDLPRLIREGHAEAACLYQSLISYLTSDTPGTGYSMDSSEFCRVLGLEK